jgi:hypothetical protein
MVASVFALTFLGHPLPTLPHKGGGNASNPALNPANYGAVYWGMTFPENR